jgi:ketosteroid isomerase-like protein
MKNLIFIIVVSAVYSACTGTTTASNESSDSTAKTATSGASSISFPYTANFSSKISIGKDSNSLVALNSYKAWEAGDMNALANTLSDSVEINFSDGSKFDGTRDSAIAIAIKYRDSLSSVKIDMDVWEPVHADDKNEDAVLAWYKETDTYKNGKVDSVYYHDINGIKNGKITFIETYMRKDK